VDKKYSLAVELKDDTKQTSNEAIGLATYSNSQSTVLSYASIFESLWRQTELYQKLKEADKIKALGCLLVLESLCYLIDNIGRVLLRRLSVDICVRFQ
jgi:hypothetical protein